MTAAEGQGGDADAARRQAWRALAILDVLIREHPDSAFTDDALLESAAIATRLGRHWDAVRFYKAILAERETSWFFGSYDTPVIRAAAAALPGATARAESAGE
ncbi:MAG: hypothetical protein FJ087_14855 [Deltaproteobacteria bacterium]|nr:hypothetical protein [Deltaproteobacteria bacterium]